MLGKKDYTECAPGVSVGQMPGMNCERKIKQEYMGNSSATLPVGPCLCSGHGMAGQQMRGTGGLGPATPSQGSSGDPEEGCGFVQTSRSSLDVSPFCLTW